MIGLLLAFLLFQTAPQASGTITGLVRSSTGSPAPRVRVYAMTYRDGVEAANTPPALESLTETDAAGRYRLEIPPGRYYIASGSVTSPTYFPNTTDLTKARVLTVAANGTIADIDFGSFVPANRNPGGGISYLTFSSGSGVLSGVVRFADGTPAPGIPVVAIPASAVGGAPLPQPRVIIAFPPPPVAQPPNTVSFQNAYTVTNPRTAPTVSVNSGAFQIPFLGADTYYIAAGYADNPRFYPGAPDVAGARSITLATATSTMDKLDFTVPAPVPGVAVRGNVSTSGGAPAAGALLRIRPRSNPALGPGVPGLPLRSPQRDAAVGVDGEFAFTDVVPGEYTLDTIYSGLLSQTQVVTVAARPVDGLRFVLPIASLSGRILMEDGSPVLDPQVLFKEAIVTTVKNPNMLASTLFPISSAGTFSRLIEADEYRFYVRDLPEEYDIRSMRSGSMDLTQETLKISGTEPVIIEVRVGKRATAAVPPDVRVSGTVTDSVTGMPPAANRVILCCRGTGPVERFTAPIGPDGSFAFSAVPPGKYEPILQPTTSNATIYPLSRGLEVGSAGLSGVTLLTTPRFGQLTATVVADGPTPLPIGFAPTVVFTDPSGRVRIVAERTQTWMYVASVPQGIKYNVVVENLPEGYAVKSVIGSTEPNVATAANMPAVGVPANAIPIVILIERR